MIAKVNVVAGVTVPNARGIGRVVIVPECSEWDIVRAG